MNRIPVWMDCDTGTDDAVAIMLAHASPELELLGLADCFDRVYLSSEAGFRKPDPRFFTAPLRELGLEAGDCLMIGNDPRCDVGGAAAVGMDAVYLRSGLSPRGAPIPEKAVLSLGAMDLKRLWRELR